MVRLQPRPKTLLAWSLWLASMGCCAGGLLAALLWVRPLTSGPAWPGCASRPAASGRPRCPRPREGGHDPVPQIDIGDLEIGQLRQPQSTIQEQHDDGVSRRAVKSVPAQVASRARRAASERTGVSGSPGAGVVIPAVASWSASPSLSSQGQKCRTPANHPRAVLLEWRSRTSTSQPWMCRRSSSARPTSGWCPTSQPARLRTAFW